MVTASNWLHNPFLVAAVGHEVAVVALPEDGRPRHLHREAQELEGIVEGPLPRT